MLRCDQCPRKYTSVRYWRQHIKSHDLHIDGPCTSGSGQIPLNIGASLSDQRTETEAESESAPLEVCCTSPDSHQERNSAWQKDIASVLISLRSEHGLKESGCTEVSDFLHHFSTSVAEEARELPGLRAEALPATTACESLKSTYRLNKFITNNYGFVAPRTIKLGANSTGIQKSFQYVPLLEQLGVLLTYHEALLEKVLKSQNTGSRSDIEAFED